MPDFLASIIINTYNREPYLHRLLAGLGQLEGRPFEIVVVNGPSTDGTSKLLEEYRDRLKIIDCPARNLSRSRNFGIAAAAGDIVVFIDDDALPYDTYWLERYLDAFKADSTGQLGAAGGPVWHRDTEWSEFNGGATSDYGFQIFDQNQIESTTLDGHRWVLRVQGCNCAFRRRALVAIGGFDEFFTYYHDETDVCLRLARAGFSTMHLPANGVRHYPATSERRTSKFDRNWRVVTRSDAYFALKNGADALPHRIGKTLTTAARKHYVHEIRSYVRRGEISRLHWLRLMSQWLSGLVSGMGAGLLQPRQMCDLNTAPAPFRTFTAPSAERRLRIALLSQTIPGQPNNGGIGRYTFDLAKGLHERGHEVHIICKDEQPLRRESLGFLVHGIPELQYASQQRASEHSVVTKNLNYSLAVLRKLSELHDQDLVFDVVHASNWDCEALSLIRSQVYPTVLMLVSPLAQVIVTENWELNDDLRSAVELDRWQIEHADAVCVPSQGVLSSYRSLMSIVPESLPQLHLTPLGIVPDPASPGPQQHGRHRLLFVGRCERRKGTHTLLEVLPELLAAFPDWECHLVGNDQVPLVEGGTLKERFLAQHRGTPWIERVIFHGAVDENMLRRHYQQCDLFVAPSLFESFGLIYHEAMQYGKAVVGCRTGGVPEVVEHGIEGLLVTPDCPNELRAALAQLMSDDVLRHSMGSAGAQRIHALMNYRTMAACMEQVYLETVEATETRCRTRREQVWPAHLPIYTPSEMLRYSGNWLTRDAIAGHTYRVGGPGATLTFEAAVGALLRLVALRHSWSGVLEVQADGVVLGYIDLYKSEEMQLQYPIDIVLSGMKDTVTLTLRVHPERNPESHASEVWLKQLTLFPPPDASHFEIQRMWRKSTIPAPNITTPATPAYLVDH